MKEQASSRMTFKDVTTTELLMIYTGENWAAKDNAGNYKRSVLIQCAKHNEYTPESAKEEAKKRSI